MKEKDKFKETEQKLYEYKILKSKIEALENKKKMIDLEEDGAKAIEYTDMPKPPSSNTESLIEQVVLRKEEKKEIINREIKRARLKIDNIEIVLNILNKDEKDLFRAKYMATSSKNVTELTRELHIERSAFHETRNSLVRKAMNVLF